jgi:hypothetical protein
LTPCANTNAMWQKILLMVSVCHFLALGGPHRHERVKYQLYSCIKSLHATLTDSGAFNQRVGDYKAHLLCCLLLQILSITSRAKKPLQHMDIAIGAHEKKVQVFNQPPLQRKQLRCSTTGQSLASLPEANSFKCTSPNNDRRGDS